MTYDEYSAMPGLRATDLKLIARSPAHYRWAADHGGQKDSAPLRFGRLAHTVVLEPHLAGAIHVFGGDRRTKAGRDDYEAQIRRAHV